MSTGLPRPGLARSAHHGRIKFLRGYVSISSAAVNRPTHDHAASLSEVARTSMRSAFRGPAHQLAVRMRINNCTHGHYGPSNQPCTSNCTSAEGLHFSAFHYIGNSLLRRGFCTFSDFHIQPISRLQLYIFRQCTRLQLYSASVTVLGFADSCRESVFSHV